MLFIAFYIAAQISISDVHIHLKKITYKYIYIYTQFIYDANLLFHHILKVLYWIEIWWLWKPFE